MRYYDKEAADHMQAAQWQIDLLALNPGYCSWGPGEDAMFDHDFTMKPSEMFMPDDLNEIANFYFRVVRDSKECVPCKGTGYHEDALWVVNSFYKHSSPFKEETYQEEQAQVFMNSFGSNMRPSVKSYPGEAVLRKYGPKFRSFCKLMASVHHWDDKITEDELQALKDSNRVDNAPTLQQVNANSRIHDGINRHILVKARLKRFGMPSVCPACQGRGYVHTAPAPHVELVLWMLHPRKGSSVGMKVTPVQQSDLPGLLAVLRSAAQRNAERFGKLT